MLAARQRMLRFTACKQGDHAHQARNEGGISIDRGSGRRHTAKPRHQRRRAAPSAACSCRTAHLMLVNWFREPDNGTVTPTDSFEDRPRFGRV